MKRLFLLTTVLCSGCATSSWVTREYQPYKAGAVKFLDAGADFIIESRRQDAMSKIQEFCGPDNYTILKESRDSSWDVYSINPGPMSGGYTATNASSPYLHIYFQCGGFAH